MRPSGRLRRAGAPRRPDPGGHQPATKLRSSAAFRTALPPPSLLKYAKTSTPSSAHSRMRSRPPRQIGGRIRPTVEMLGIRPVQPHVGEAGSDPQDAGQPRSAHHAVGGAVSLQERENVFMEPGFVAELHRRAQPAGQLIEEPGQPVVIAGLLGRQLNQEDAAPVRQFVQPGGDAFDPGFRAVEAFRMGESTGRLHRHQESGWEPPAPGRERGIRRPPVETGVEFDGVECLDVAGEPVARVRAGRVQHAVPVVVTPAGGADPDLAHDPALPSPPRGSGCAVKRPWFTRQASLTRSVGRR